MLMLAVGWPSAAFTLTAAEILSLKKGGVGDETIQIMLQQEAAAKTSAKDTAMGRQEIRDSNGVVSIQYSTGSSKVVNITDTEQQKVDKAWEILRHLIISPRKNK
jgi:hypothetical protein